MILEAKNIVFSYKYSNGAETEKRKQSEEKHADVKNRLELAEERLLYNNFNLTVGSNERVGIAAPSGFGKTTLCKLMAGYENPYSGDVLLDGKSLVRYKGYNPVQMIWQHPEMAVDPRIKMKNVLLEGDFGYKKADDIKNIFSDHRGSNAIVKNIVDGLGIREEWLERYAQELSGGELMRFCIARALGERTRFIVADEISTMFDLVTQKQIWDFIINETERRKIGMIIVSHSYALLDRVCTRIEDLTEKM